MAAHCKQLHGLSAVSSLPTHLTCVDLRLDVVISWVLWNPLIKRLHSTSKRDGNSPLTPRRQEDTGTPKQETTHSLHATLGEVTKRASLNSGKRLHGIYLIHHSASLRNQMTSSHPAYFEVPSLFVWAFISLRDARAVKLEPQCAPPPFLLC